MRTFIAIASLFLLAKSQCDSRPNNEAVENAAYIFQLPSGNLSNGGNRCEMRRCSGGGPIPLWNTSMVNFMDSQMCNMTNGNQMGCDADTYVRSTLVSSSWYGQGCKFCKSTCTEANSNNVRNVPFGDGKRNSQNLRFFETTHSGKTCNMMQCANTQCIDPTRSPQNVSGWAYFPKSGMPTWRFPSLTDNFQVVQKSSWTEFDLPTSYACTPTQASGSPHLCDYKDTDTEANITLWTGARHWQWNAGQSESESKCVVKQCNGNDVMQDLFSTTDIGSATIKPEWANYILNRCGNWLRGCETQYDQWYWGPTSQAPTTLSSSDCSVTSIGGFCSRLACKCSAATNTKVYNVVQRNTIFTGSGLVTPGTTYTCYEGTCLAASTPPSTRWPTLLSNSYVARDSSKWIPITTAECPSPKFYYDGTSNTPIRGSVKQGIAVAWRTSSNINLINHGVAPELHCSAMKYQIPITSNSKCYRSPFYENIGYQRAFGTQNNCSSYTAPKPWISRTGANCSVSYSFKACQLSLKSSTDSTSEYQKANTQTYDKKWVEYQCYQNASNFKMASICEKGTDQIRAIVDPPDSCYRKRAALEAYLGAVTCKSGVATSATADPTYLADYYMQNHQCDADLFQKLFRTVVQCACSEASAKGEGGATAYSMQTMYQWELAFGNTNKIPNDVAALAAQLNSLGCTYHLDCKAGAGSVKVMRPRIKFTFVVATQCKYVDWTNLRAKIETVMVRDAAIVSRGIGREGGVNFMWDQMTNDATSNTCSMPSWTWCRVPTECKWFVGNHTASSGGKRSFLTTSVKNMMYEDDVASPVRVGGSSRVVPSLLVLVVAGVLSFLF